MTDPTLILAKRHTWPPASTRDVGPWLIRDGAGGGKRVSSTLAIQDVTVADLASAEGAMGLQKLFNVEEREAELDTILAENGYSMIDPTLYYEAPIDQLCAPVPPVTVFDIWPPLGINREIWKAGGIGPERVSIMERAALPKTAFLGRINGRAAGTAFAAIHQNIAMIHAVEILERFRRNGLARHVMHGAANWAKAQGAKRLAILVTEANHGARALYEGLGMTQVGRYHYRIKQEHAGEQTHST